MKRISFKFTSFEWILIGLIIHAIGRIFFLTSKPISYSLCGLALVFIFYNAIFRLKHQVPFNGIVRFFFFFYLFWNVGIILRPFITGENFNKDGYSPINQYAWLSYLVPCICFINSRQISIPSVFRVSYLHSFIGIILITIFFRDIFSARQFFDDESYQEYIGTTSIPSSFLGVASYALLWFSFVSKPYRIMSIIAWGLGVFTSAFAARRGGVFTYLIILAFFIFQFISSSKSKGIKIILITLIITILGTSALTYLNSTFSLLFSRLGEDTRSGVEDYFFKSFEGKLVDWIFGRGINGTYYCPIFKDLYRNVIETGYLNMILKGGIIHLIGFVFFLVHSSYLGLFKSKNTLSRAMSLYLVMHLIALVPFGIPSFSFQYVVLWIFIACCQSIKFRSLDNLSLIKYILNSSSSKLRPL
ncbi:hypothetical protein [Emticicia fluvialis]|uniref:hypothetical protein n=1 Tax=Emticicia fluvialis TaxID=2974474 RepID=UPI002165625C|nr:hypothetical protein [Emticicia fluvialis]